MKWILIGLAVFVLLVVVMLVIGALLPRRHVASRAAVIHQPANRLFAALEDFTDQPSWRTGVQRIEPLPPNAGLVRYREVSRHGAITYVVRESIPAQKLVTEIADQNLPYDGSWTFELTPEGEGTRVRITERGEVKNAVFRVLARFVFGYTTTIEAYLRDLGRKFGENAVLED
jgi:uncharacterized protein YndB with AHSA1/START domain